MEHSKVLGGSSAGRLLNCGLSRFLCQHAPEPKAKEAALKGRLFHAALEKFFSEDLDPESLVGFRHGKHTLKEADYQAIILPSIEMTENIVYEVFGKDWRDLKRKVETRVVFKSVPGSFGTLDLLIYDVESSKALLVDFKSGYKEVSAIDNSQQNYYACAAIDSIEELSSINEFHFAIAQPKINKEAVSYWITYLDDLNAFKEQLTEAALEPDGIAREGKWCDFAPCAAECPIKSENLNKLLEFDVENLLSGNEKVKALDIYDTCQSALQKVNQILDIMGDQMQAGKELRGLKLKTNHGHSKWGANASDEKIIAICATYGIGKDQLTKPCVLKSPTDILKLMNKNGVSSDDIQSFISNYIERNISSYAIEKE